MCKFWSFFPCVQIIIFFVNYLIYFKLILIHGILTCIYFCYEQSEKCFQYNILVHNNKNYYIYSITSKNALKQYIYFRKMPGFGWLSCWTDTQHHNHTNTNSSSVADTLTSSATALRRGNTSLRQMDSIHFAPVL